MFAYLNIPVLVIIGVIFLIDMPVGTKSKDESSETKDTNYLLWFMVVLVFMAAWFAADNEKESIDNFKAGKVLKCFSGGGMYNKARSYKVSSEDGWKIYKDEFVKESVVLEPNQCDIW